MVMLPGSTGGFLLQPGCLSPSRSTDRHGMHWRQNVFHCVEVGIIHLTTTDTLELGLRCVDSFINTVAAVVCQSPRLAFKLLQAWPRTKRQRFSCSEYNSKPTLPRKQGAASKAPSENDFYRQSWGQPTQQNLPTKKN